MHSAGIHCTSETNLDLCCVMIILLVCCQLISAAKASVYSTNAMFVLNILIIELKFTRQITLLVTCTCTVEPLKSGLLELRTPGLYKQHMYMYMYLLESL